MSADPDPALLAAALGFAGAAIAGRAVAIRDGLPRRPCGISVPLTVPAGLLAGWGAGVAAPWPMPVTAVIAAARSQRTGQHVNPVPVGPGCASVADHAARDEHRGQEQPDQAPPAVDRVNQYDGSDRDAGQRGGQRWCRVPGRRLRPAGGGGGCRGCGPEGRKVGCKLPELTPGPRGQRPPGSLVEFPGCQPARLEVLAEVRHHRVTVGIRGPHRSGTIIPGHDVHRFLAFVWCRCERVPCVSTVVGTGPTAPLPDDTTCG